ncbi:MAG: imidazolonepropionase [Minwuiales bacterium]|nr:imidazolonepropionase [Minwuiales bacterium]
MTDWDLLFTNACVMTMDGDDAAGRIDGGAIAIADGRIAWVGRSDALPDGSAGTVRDLGGLVVTPGLVDPHTHIVYGEESMIDFEVLSQGGGRAVLESKGGGVGGLVRRTREMPGDALYAASRKRMSRLIANGVTTVESKSGSGLDLETELGAMRISRALDRDLPVTVVSTFLGAHGLPPEYRDRRDAYVDFLCDTVLPAAVQQGLVDQVDGFCDAVGFTHAQIGRLFDRATSYGLPVKLHADQYTDFGAGALVAKFGGLSADHCEYASEATVRAMAAAGTVATLLPGANWTLRETQKPPVALFREYDVPLALATNCNPVSSPATAPAAVMHMACYMFGLTPDEALRGFTVNAAKALGMADRAGRIAVGRTADLAVWDTADPRGIAYPIGGVDCLAVVKDGTIVHEASPPAFGVAP